MIRNQPVVRITSEGTSRDTKVELITKSGTVVDLSSVVSRVSWQLDASSGVAAAELIVLPGALEVMGDLTNVKVESGE